MPDSIFQPVTEPLNPFVEPDQNGTGSETLDSFIASRAGVMMDGPDMLKQLALSQENVRRMDSHQLNNYISGLVSKAVSGMTLSALDHYGERGDVEGGVKAIKEVQEISKPKSNIEQLALAAPAYLAQFGEVGKLPREIARRDYAMAMFAAKLEEAGLTPNTLGKQISGIAGTLIPGRQLWQYGTSDIDLDEAVLRLHGMKDDEFFKELPKVMDAVLEQSGNNPFYFLERMQAFIDPEDIYKLKAFLALDVVDAAAVASIAPRIAKIMKLTRSSNTPIKLLRDTGKIDRAAELNVAAAGDEGAAKSAQVEMADAAQSISPFGGEGIDPGITNKIAPASQKVIADQVAATTNEFAPLHDPNFFLKVKTWKPHEIEKANAKYLSNFAGDARVVEQFDDGATIEVTINKPNIWPDADALALKINELEETKVALKEMLKNAKSRGKGSKKQTALFKESIEQANEDIVRYQDILNRTPKNRPAELVEVRRIKIQYRQNDYGELDTTEIDKAIRYVNSPSTWVNQMVPDYVEDATITDFQTARGVLQMMKARNNVLRGLNKASRKKVDAVLLQGDRDQVVYKDADLLNGVRTPEGLIKFETEEQFASYRSARAAFDGLHELKEYELGQSLRLGGFKALYPEIDGAPQIHFANPDRNLPLSELNNIKRIYSMEDNMVVDADALRKNPGLSTDLQIVELKYPMEINDEIINYVISPRSRFKEIPAHGILARRTGYVTKIDKDVFWLVERIGDKMVDGNKITNHRTLVRYFDNPKDAREWVSGQKAKGENVELLSADKWLDAKPGRREEFEAGVFGGLYSGKRAERVIPFGLEGTEAERVGAFESMEAYMNHISARLPAVNFRASLIQRFLNSARGHLRDPADWKSEIVGVADHREYSGLKGMQDWVKDQLRIPTTEERVWSYTSQKIAEVLSRVPGTAGSKLSKWGMKMGVNDVASRIRGLSFHATLGWLNFSQLGVQAMGATIAMSMAPEKALLDIPRSLAMRAAMFEVSKSDDALRVIAKAALLPEDSFIDMVRGFQRTGLHEATLSSGDYAAINGLPHGWDSLRFIADKGLIFFKEGERFARNYAWIRAWDEITKGGKIKLTDDLINTVTRRSLKYMINLNRANRAYWQRGILSIPTQFWQISAKFIENMLPSMLIKNPSGWTGKQKAQIMLMQIAMFGTAGIPFGSTMYNSMQNWLQSDDEFGLAIKDPKALTAIQGGLTELLMYDWTGERLDITNRLSIPAGIESMIEIMTSDQSSAMDMILGVSGEIGDRTWQATRANARILASIVKDPESMDASVITDVMDESAKVMSSWRNYRKAQVWKELHYIEDRYHNKIIPLDDTDDRALLFAQALGVSPKVMADYFNIKGFNKNTDQDYRDAAQAVMDVSFKYYGDPDILTNEKKQRRMEAEIAICMLGFEEEEKRKVLHLVDEKLKKDGYKLPEEMEKALDNMYNKQGAPDLQSNVTMLDGGS